MAPDLGRLAALIDGWVSLAALLSYRDLQQDQRPPWASLSHGAAGNAYALWYVATRQDRPDAWKAAGRWWRFAVRGADRRSGFRSAAYRGIPLRASVAFGRPGLQVVEALLSHPKPIASRRALTTLGAIFDQAGEVPAEFMVGLAGELTAALQIARCTGSDEMAAVADRLGDRLLAAASIPIPIPINGFAHGRVGVQHALLSWCEQTRRVPPAALVAALVAPTDDEIISHAGTLPGSWCNGLAGFLMLWVKAYELTRDDAWRTRAVACARTLATLPSVDGTLCCGDGGRAYALLALARIDDREDWRGQALAACTQRLAEIPAHGVLRGLPGIVCLAVDLITPGRARFPLVEA
ncbi:MAG: hypothetical protein NT062_30980 [Proteobacteria bacterium]|nr:hypothetical protein [Pseudomonadota bacterium]